MEGWLHAQGRQGEFGVSGQTGIACCQSSWTTSFVAFIFQTSYLWCKTQAPTVSRKHHSVLKAMGRAVGASVSYMKIGYMIKVDTIYTRNSSLLINVPLNTELYFMLS